LGWLISSSKWVVQAFSSSKVFVYHEANWWAAINQRNEEHKLGDKAALTKHVKQSVKLVIITVLCDGGEPKYKLGDEGCCFE